MGKTKKRKIEMRLLSELFRSLLMCFLAALLILWLVETYVVGKELQILLAEDLVTIVITLAAACVAVQGLLMSQIANICRIPSSSDEAQKLVIQNLSTIEVALRDSFYEMICQVVLAVLLKGFYRSKGLADFSLHYYSWGYFVFDVLNMTVLFWALWLLFDLGRSQFSIFGELTRAVNRPGDVSAGS